MNESYTPPEMPPYPTSYDEVMQSLAPYYKEERPLDFFFEMHVSDIIDELPKESIQALDVFSEKHPTFFESTNGSWKEYVITQCHLSETFEIAVWDLWIRNTANAKENGWTFHPRHFSQVLMEKYFEDGSKVDVWEGSSLQEAKQRIETYRKNKS